MACHSVPLPPSWYFIPPTIIHILPRALRDTTTLPWMESWTHTRRQCTLIPARTIPALLHKFNITDAKPKDSPYNEKASLDGDADSPLLSTDMSTLFRQTIGDLRYAADSTRPDVFHLVNRLSTYMKHWDSLKSLLRYLQKNPSHGLLYTPSNHRYLYIYSKRIRTLTKPTNLNLSPALALCTPSTIPLYIGHRRSSQS